MNSDDLREIAREIDSYYPVDVWPEVTPDELRALHEWAKTIGRADGSAFHVAGIRHGMSLVRVLADRMDEATS